MKKIAGHIPINRPSSRFPSRFIPSVPPGDAIRRCVGRGEYRFSLGRSESGEKNEKSQTSRQAGRRAVHKNLTMIFIE